jgi:hypothetical protein
MCRVEQGLPEAYQLGDLNSVPLLLHLGGVLKGQRTSC